jgi:RNA polymerase sigma factor (sigma-70 family)
VSRLAARGDRRALAAIYDRFHQPLYRYCYSILRDAEDAADALQSTMAKVLLALPGEKREIALKPWLYRIAHNEAIEILRHRRPNAELREATHLAGPALEEHSEQRRRLDELVRDISTLPERQRGALLMRELSGLSYGEIAQAFGTTPAVAKQSVYEARIGLRDQAEGREMDCATVQSAISARDGRVLRGRRIRSHLRSCTICRAFDESIAGRRRDLAAVVPAMPAAAATSVLHGLIGGAGHGAGGGGGLLATLGGGAGKTFAGSAAFKAAALAAVTVGAGAGALEGIPAITGDHGGVPPAGVAPALQPASLPAGPGGAAATATWHSSGVSTAQSRSRSGDAASGAIHPQHSPSAAPPAEPASAPQSAATTPGHEQAANAPAQSHAHPSPPRQAGGPAAGSHAGPSPAAGSHATPQPALIPPAHEHPAHPLGPTIPTLPETGQPVQGSATPAPPSPASGSGDKP